MKNKSEMLAHFKTFHIMVERKIEKLLKCLRSDNGGAHCSKNFDDYGNQCEIRHEKIVFHSPQLNKAAERMN